MSSTEVVYSTEVRKKSMVNIKVYSTEVVYITPGGVELRSIKDVEKDIEDHPRAWNAFITMNRVNRQNIHKFFCFDKNVKLNHPNDITTEVNVTKVYRL